MPNRFFAQISQHETTMNHSNTNLLNPLQKQANNGERAGEPFQEMMSGRHILTISGVDVAPKTPVQKHVAQRAMDLRHDVAKAQQHFRSLDGMRTKPFTDSVFAKTRPRRDPQIRFGPNVNVRCDWPAMQKRTEVR